jgi:hypothetical protein
MQDVMWLLQDDGEEVDDSEFADDPEYMAFKEAMGTKVSY